MKTAFIIGGGDIDLDFLKDMLFKKNDNDIVIAADRGMKYLHEIEIIPDILLGDMDSIPEKLYENIKNTKIDIELHPVRKDDTDMRLAMLTALEKKADRIYMLGSTGGRLDHFMANIYIMLEAALLGVDSYIYDRQNKISILLPGSYELHRRERFGKYVSFMSIGGKARIKSLRGFSYDCDEHIFTETDTLGISNEIVSETANIELLEGKLLMIESKDGVYNE